MKNYYDYYYTRDNDRFFWAPFLLGGLGGAAVVGLSRPRPVFVNPVPPYRPPYYPGGPYPYGAQGGFGYSNYNYYY